MKLTIALFVIAAIIAVSTSCQKLPVTGERGLIYGITHPMSPEEWAEASNGGGGGSQ